MQKSSLLKAASFFKKGLNEEMLSSGEGRIRRDLYYAEERAFSKVKSQVYAPFHPPFVKSAIARRATEEVLTKAEALAKEGLTPFSFTDPKPDEVTGVG